MVRCLGLLAIVSVWAAAAHGAGAVAGAPEGLLFWTRFERGPDRAYADRSASGYVGRDKGKASARAFDIETPLADRAGRRVRGVEWPAANAPGIEFKSGASRWRTPAQGLTVELWINIRELPPAPRGRALLVCKPRLFWLSINHRGQIGGGIRLQAESKPYPYFDFAVPYSRLPLNRWVHVAQVYDAAAHTTTYFVDGKRIYRRTAMRRTDYRIHHAGERWLDAPIVIGKNFVGAIADVKIWNCAKMQFDRLQTPTNPPMKETRVE